MARRTRTRRLCLFCLWNQVSSSSLWLLRECVLIVPLHNSVLSFPAGLWPRLPTPALVHWCKASKQCKAAVLLRATVGQSPRVGVFSNNSVSNPVSELNCIFVIFSLWMSVCLCCGSMDSCFWTPLVAFISAVAVVPRSHSPTSLFFQSRATHFVVTCEAWNMGCCVGIWQMLSLRRLPACTY